MKLYEIKDSLDYRVSSRTARTIQKNPVSGVGWGGRMHSGLIVTQLVECLPSMHQSLNAKHQIKPWWYRL